MIVKLNEHSYFDGVRSEARVQQLLRNMRLNNDNQELASVVQEIVQNPQPKPTPPPLPILCIERRTAESRSG
jgi:hypothetical protein